MKNYFVQQVVNYLDVVHMDHVLENYVVMNYKINNLNKFI